MTSSIRSTLARQFLVKTWPARILVAGAIFLLAYAVGLIVQPSHQYIRFQSNFVYLLAPVATFALAPHAVRASRGSVKLGFLGFTILIATWTMADSLFTYYDLMRGSEPPFPGITDLLYYVGYAGFLAGVAFTTYPASKARDARWLLDTLTLSVAAIVVVGEYLIRPILSQDYPFLSRLVLLGYPVLDLAILVLLIGALYSSRGRPSRRALLLIAAAAILIVTDLGYFYMVSVSGYENVGNPLDLGYIASYALLATSFVLPEEAQSAVGPEKATVLSSGLPMFVCLGMFALLIQNTLWGSDSLIIQVGAVGVIILVLGRHLMTLEQTDERYLALAQRPGDIVFIIDSDTYILFVSPSVKTSLDYSPEDLIGSTFSVLLSREDAGSFRVFLLGLVARPRPAVFEGKIIHRDLSTRTFRITGNDRRQQPSIGGILLVGTDVTPHRQPKKEVEREAA